ncbi:MAG: hypothetical protein CMI26_15040 [Opitutae bacterium]|nr:hypothetical protein [Opitutae bacterium]|tara:strand:+ start:4119 stop:5168 length:1050 start_codon:yes stop_codon:yes gene_type:complete
MKIILLAIIFAIPCLGQTARWYKGNTHAHTTLCGHADSPPAVVAQWYHDHGYHFAILSEHNKFIDPKTVKLKGEIRKDFLLLPGEEVTGRKTVHSTAMNVNRLVPWHFDHGHRSKIIQKHVDETIKAGGATILNHPNFGWAIQAKDMLPVKKLYLFELYNGHPSVRNFGDHKHPSTEELWDDLLTQGMTIYGVGSDDAHHFGQWNPGKSNPGRGWVMVRTKELTSDAITKAMTRGDFYASSGVMLKKVVRDSKRIEIEVDEEATSKELTSPILYGRKVKEGKPGYSVEFIGPKGKVIRTSNTAKASCEVALPYLRCKVTRRVKGKDGSLLEHYAWVQPVFTDERAKQTE